MAEYDQMTRDLAHKASDDAVGAVKRTLDIAPGGLAQQTMIATMAAGQVLAIATAYFKAKIEAENAVSCPSDTVVDGLWLTLRPIVLAGVEANKVRLVEGKRP